MRVLFVFFNDTAPTEIYTLSLHDALPIWHRRRGKRPRVPRALRGLLRRVQRVRSEEHTSELQSLTNLVCRLLLEKKKTIASDHTTSPNLGTDCLLPSCVSLAKGGTLLSGA